MRWSWALKLGLDVCHAADFAPPELIFGHCLCDFVPPELILNSCFSDTVFVTWFRTAVERAVSGVHELLRTGSLIFGKSVDETHSGLDCWVLSLVFCF